MDEFEQFYVEFVEESDRAAVVLGAAKLDDILFRILENRLLPPSDPKQDELLQVNKPLGTMSSRIDLVYRLGLITNDFRRSLHLIRKIRNAFAHNLEGCSFKNAAIRSQVTEIFVPYKDRLFTAKFMKIHFGQDKTDSAKFRTVLAIHMHRPNVLAKNVARIQADEAWHPLMPNWERLVEKGLMKVSEL